MKGLRLKNHESITGLLFCLPSIVGMVVFFVIPFCIAIRMSFSESIGNASFIGLKNYITVMKSSAFKLAALNTFKFDLAAIPLIMVISFIIAMLLFRKLHGSEIFHFSIGSSNSFGDAVFQHVFPSGNARIISLIYCFIDTLYMEKLWVQHSLVPCSTELNSENVLRSCRAGRRR